MADGELVVNFKAFLKTTKLDKHGAKTHSLECSGKEAISSAKLELMSRDFDNYLPILLDVTIKVAEEQSNEQSLNGGCKSAGSKKQAQTIR